MVHPRSRGVTRPRISADAIDVILAAGAVLMLGLGMLLTPAFTDYEVEAEDAMHALISGHFGEAMRQMPFYSGAVIIASPFGAIAHALGGGDLAVFRAVAIPGAVVVAYVATIVGRWMREGGLDRRAQLLTIGAVALSPCLAEAWTFGHFEEPLVAGLGLVGLLVAARGDDRSALLAGAILGVASASKLWAIVLIPVALAALPSRSAAIRLLAAGALTGAVLLLPYAIARLDHLEALAGGTGEIFTRGNVWWFTGTPNPAYVEDPAVRQYMTTLNSARLAPDLIELHARKLIVLASIALSAAWWRRIGRLHALTPEQRLASIFALAAAVLWWRALLDPWYQPYYLTGALMAMFLADARAGRFPVIGLVAWAAIWLLDGQSAPHLGLDADQSSALSLAWTVPVGIVLVVRALSQTSERPDSLEPPDRRVLADAGTPLAG